MLFAIIVDDKELALLDRELDGPIHGQIGRLRPPPPQPLLGEVHVGLTFDSKRFIDAIYGSLGSIRLALIRSISAVGLRTARGVTAANRSGEVLRPLRIQDLASLPFPDFIAGTCESRQAGGDEQNEMLPTRAHQRNPTKAAIGVQSLWAADDHHVLETENVFVLSGITKHA
jgi:hypothetical protein